MQKFKTKVLSVLLTMCMLVGMLQPMGALVVQAAEATNVAQGKTVTTNAPFVNKDMPLSNIVDGNVSAGDSNQNYGEFGADAQGATDGAYYVQIDLRDVYDVNKVNLYRYFNDQRTYGATVIALAEETAEFDSKTADVVYNSDEENAHGFGNGKDAKYAESGNGKTWEFNGVTARYVRLYMCGLENGGKNNHIVECEVWGVPHETTAPDPTPTPDETATPIETSHWDVHSVNGTKETSDNKNESATNADIKALITDDNAASFWNSAWVAGNELVTGVYFVAKLDGIYDITQVDYTPRWDDNAKWNCTGNVQKLILEYSEDGNTWAKATPEEGIDLTSLIASTDKSSFPAALKLENAVAAQYIRISGTESVWNQYMNGQKGITIGDLDIYGIYKSAAPEPTPEPTVDKTTLNKAIADAEALTSSDYTEASWKAVEDAVAAAKALAETADQAAVNAAAKAINDAITALVDAGEGGDDLETENKNVLRGKTPSAVAWLDGRTMQHTESGETDDNSAGKATDGQYGNAGAFYRYGEAASGADRRSYVEYNFGGVYEVTNVNLWRYFADGRNYDPTTIVISTDKTFDTNDTVIYSTDENNTYGFGTELVGTTNGNGYNETSTGLKLDLTGKNVSGQYIRIYASGSNINTGNHLVEFEVYANVPVLPEPEPAFKNAETYQDFPTHYQDRESNFRNDTQLHVGGQVVHPDVVYMKNGWNGYKYWIVYTPNTMVTSQYENPYIAASNDGVTWVEPEGIQNPIEPEPVNTNLHNCDADMIYNEEMDAMMAYWNWANDNNWSEAPLGAEVRVRISYDGIHWGVPSTYDEETGIWTKPKNESERTLKPATTDKWGLDNSFITAVASRDRYDMLSPTFTYDSYRDIYVMWANNTGDVGYNNGQNNHVDIRWSKDGLNWSDATPVNNFLDKTAEGQSLAPWHQDVNYIEELKEYWAFSQCFTGRNPDGSMLYLTRSKDGINWEQVGTTAAMNPGEPGSWDDFQIYRTCFVYDDGDVKVWYSSLQQDTANKQIIDSSGNKTITAGPDDTRIWRIGYTSNTYKGIMTALTGNGEKPALVTGTALNLTADKTELEVGEEGQVTVGFTPENTSDQIVKYTSSNEKVAEVTPFGEVIAVGAGTAVITAETQDNISDTVEITVGEAAPPVVPSGVEWYDVPYDGEDIVYEGSWGADSLGKNTYEADASATLVFYGTGIKWIGQKDSNFGQAIVTLDGTDYEVNTNGSAVTGVEHFVRDNLTEGVHTITIKPKSQGTSDSGVIDINKFVVQYDKTWDIKVSSVTAQTSADSIRIGKTTTVTAYVQPFNAVNKTVTYESEDPTIASVSDKGVVTGLAAGVATIQAIADGAEAAVDITVTDGTLPAKRIAISNEEPLLIVPVYGQEYKASGSELQWGDTLLGRWNSIPADIKDNVVMEIHCMRAGGQAKDFYTQQLEIAQENNIPVMIVTANGGSAQFRGDDGAAWLDAAMKKYSCLKGFIITENYWTDYNGVATEAGNHLRVAAENGGYLVWYEHKAGVMESILTNASFRPAVEEYGSNLAFTWKNTPIEQNAATASYMQGLWLEGVIDQWGGLMDSWKWWELGYAELFNPTTSLTNGGNGRGHIGKNSDGDGEETRACVMEPEAMLGIQMMSIYANGGAIYSFEHPAYTQGVNDKNTPAFENVIYDTFKHIMENPAPSKEEVLADTEVMIHGNISSNTNIFTNVTMKNQALPTYFTGQYSLIPSVPASITVDNVDVSKVVNFSNVNTADKLKNHLNGKYTDSAYEGTAFAQKVDDTWILYNSIYNEANTKQDATVHVGAQSVKVEMEPHTYAIMDKNGTAISVYLNNYRVNKDEIWEGYNSSVWKWDPDVNTLMQEWIEGSYIVNTKDGSETYRETKFTLTGLDAEPSVNVLNKKEADFDVDVAYADGTAVITVTANGYVEFTITPNEAGEDGGVTDKSGLADTIQKAEEAEEATKEPVGGSVVVVGKDAYDEAKAEADEVHANPNATQEEINAADAALKAAIAGLASAAVVPDDDEAVAEEADEFIADILVAGDYEGKPTVHQYMIEATDNFVVSAEKPAIMKIPVAGIEKGDIVVILHKDSVKNKWVNMADAIVGVNFEEDYVLCKFENFSPVLAYVMQLADTTEAKEHLKEQISEAEALKEENYSPETWKTLEEAIEEAKGILKDDSATWSELEKAADAVKDAIAGLKAPTSDDNKTSSNSGTSGSKGSADKKALKKAIKKAEKLYEADYTCYSWDEIEDALEKAKEVYDDKGATQGEVDKAVALLNAAFNSLQYVSKLIEVFAPAGTTPVKTGDSANIGLMVALLGIAAAAFVIVNYKKKRS